jgi:hypothetical protein
VSVLVDLGKVVQRRPAVTSSARHWKTTVLTSLAPYLPWLYWLVLLGVHCTGWFLNLLGLPGLWLMVIGHAAFGWVTGWNVYVGWPSLIAIFAVAVLAEVVEFVAGAAGSAQAGGTKRGMIGAIIGGLAGGIVGSILIPVPVVGTIIGAVAGSFAGAVAIERLIVADTDRAIRVGMGAAKGRFLGIVSKSVFGGLMMGVSLLTALPLNASATAAPATQSATQPATAPLAPTTSPATRTAQ